MLSTIVDGGGQSDRINYITNLKIPITSQLAPDPTSIGIKAVQELVLSLAISSANPRLVWIEEAQTLTPEASNTLLKVLEEPPSNTIIYLTCPNSSALLPTIRSRCQIITIPITHDPSPVKILPSLKPLFALSPGDRLTHLSDFPSDKSELLVYFRTLSQEITQTIKTTTSQTGLSLLSSLAKLALTTHQDLASNVNQTLTLSHFLLHLPRTK